MANLHADLTVDRGPAPGVLQARSPGAFSALSHRLRERPAVFLRHIAPADIEAPIPEHSGPAARKAATAAALGLADEIDASLSFSVQSRVSSSWSGLVNAGELSRNLSALLKTRSGAPLDPSRPMQILSVFVGPSTVQLGWSAPAENISNWPGGCVRFRSGTDMVSRSERKLEEAVAAFDLRLAGLHSAVDLGAAPGGWTRILRTYGLHVLAVDPAELDPRVRADSGVRHLRSAAAQWLARPEPVDVIVNDMRQDAAASVGVMVAAAGQLRPGGIGVMTLKLPEQATTASTLKTVRSSLARLASAYDVVGARHLYHNRSEITVALRPKRRVETV
jgi:23S rRNA (cytidine2498-2'-O)-methyltransferase